MLHLAVANVTATADWQRYGIGGHNVEAHATVCSSTTLAALDLGVTLARLEKETCTAELL